MSNCIWIGVGITIPQKSDLFREYSSVSKALADEYKSTLLINKTNPPHINLYDLDVPYSTLNTVADKLDNTLRDTPSFEIAIDGISMFHFGLVYLSIKKSLALDKLQENMIKAISPLKEDCLCADYLKANRKYSDGQKEMLKLYGNPFVLSEFNPHITVGFLRNPPPNIDESFRNLVPKINFYVDEIHLRWQLNGPSQPVQDYRNYYLTKN